MTLREHCKHRCESPLKTDFTYVQGTPHPSEQYSEGYVKGYQDGHEDGQLWGLGRATQMVLSRLRQVKVGFVYLDRWYVQVPDMLNGCVVVDVEGNVYKSPEYPTKAPTLFSDISVCDHDALTRIAADRCDALGISWYSLILSQTSTCRVENGKCNP